MSKRKKILTNNLAVIAGFFLAISFVLFGIFALLGVFSNHSLVRCTVLCNETGSFAVSQNGGTISCVQNGNAITFDAQTKEGYTFLGYFLDENLDAISLETQYTVSASSPNIVAKFAKNYDIALEVVSPFDAMQTQIINTSAYVGQDVVISDLVQQNCDESWAEYYTNSVASNQTSAENGYIFGSNVITVGSSSANLAVKPSDPALVGVSVPSGYSATSKVLVFYGGTGIEDYAAVSTSSHVFTLKEERADCKIYTCTNWSFQYLWDGWQAFFQTTAKEGYLFSHWTVNLYCTEIIYSGYTGQYRGWSVDMNITPNSNIVGYGFSPIGMVVVSPVVIEGCLATFHSDDSTVMHKQTYSKNAAMTLPMSPTKEGFTFAGWSTSPSSTTIVWSSGTKVINQHTKFYPVWKRDNTLKYATINPSGIREVLIDSETSTELCPANNANPYKVTYSIDQIDNKQFTYDGKLHTFVGFSDQEDKYLGVYANAENIAGLLTQVEVYGKEVMLYAIYSTTITVSYNPNGGQNEPLPETATICKSGGASQIQNQTLMHRLSSQVPTIEDGIFQGWVLDDVLYEVGGFAPIVWNTTMRAEWLIDCTLPGAGTASDPYTISSAREYKRFLSGVNDGRYIGTNQYFKLLASFQVEYYEPVGIYDGVKHKMFDFKGIFDGNGQTLTFDIDWSGQTYVGAFGYNSGTIKNLSVAGKIAGGTYVGGVCGYNVGTILGCQNYAQITGTGNFVAGVCGYNLGIVDKAFNAGQVLGINQVGQYLAGAVGQNAENAITRNAINEGQVSADTYQNVGGVVGSNLGSLMNVQNNGSVNASTYVGGIVGTNNATIINGYNSGRIKSLSVNVGAIAGSNSGTLQYLYYFTNSAMDSSERIQKAVGSSTLGGQTADPNHVFAFMAEGSGAAVTFQNQSGLSLMWALNLGLEYYSLVDGNVYCSWTQRVSDGYATMFEDDWNSVIGQGSVVAGWSGSGTLSDPYQIASSFELTLLQHKVSLGLTYKGAFFKQTHNITFPDDHSEEWFSIGGVNADTGKVVPFEGTFDGGGYTISNIYMNRSTKYYGLFGYTTGLIQNIHLIDCDITGDTYVGGITGYNTGTIVNCVVEGVVGGKGSYIGGIVGVNNGQVDRCVVKGEVVGKAQDFGLALGGIAGINLSSANVKNCYSSALVQGKVNQWVGGIVGQNHGPVLNSYNHGSIGGAYYVGGIAGQHSGELVNCYSIGAVKSANTFAGGVVGLNNYGVVDFCYYLEKTAFDGQSAAQKGMGCGTLGSVVADVIGSTTAFDQNINLAQTFVAGHQSSNLLEALNFGQKYCENKVKGTYSVWTNDQHGLPSLFTNNEWNGIEFYAFDGAGTQENPFLICNEDDLYYLSLYVNSGSAYTGIYFLQTNDITLSKYADISWNPIGTYNTEKDKSYYFAGIYDGQHFAIKNLYQNSSKDYQGLFGYNIGTIKNVGIVDSNLTAGTYFGGICGYNTGVVEDCYSYSVVVSTGSYVGGVVGINAGIVNKCYNLGAVEAKNTSFALGIGGVVGFNLSYGEIYNCFNSGSIVANNGQWVGGVVGQNHGVLENCFNTGSARGAYYVGGIAGQNSGTIENAYSSGNVSSINTYAGAITGFNNTGKVANTYYLASSCSDGNGFKQNADGCGVRGKATPDQQGQSAPFDLNGKMQGNVKVNGSNVSTLLDALCVGQNALAGKVDNKYCTWSAQENAFATLYSSSVPPVIWNPYESPNALQGDGSEENPYLIYSVEQLKGFAWAVNGGNKYIGKIVRLMNNLDFEGTLTNLWTPIGIYDEIRQAENYFAGTFDGNGFAVEGIFTNSNLSYQGFFGYNAGTIINLTVDGQVQGNKYVGGLVGYNIGTIEYCTNKCSVTADGSYIGGLVGVNSGTITSSSNLGAVENKNTDFALAVGGVAGINLSYGSITNSYSQGSVIAQNGQWVGGVVGQNHGDIINSYSSANVSGKFYVGGIAGQSSGTIQNVCSYGTISGLNTFVGAIAGLNNSGKIEYAYYLSDKAVDGKKTFQGGVGSDVLGQKVQDVSGQFAAFDLDLKTNTDVLGEPQTNLMDALNKFVFAQRQNALGLDAWTTSATKMPIFGFAKLMWNGTATNTNFDGRGTQEDPYQIATAEQLAGFAQRVNSGISYEDKYFVLTQDIYLNHQKLFAQSANANAWQPISGFGGNLDGQNFAVHGVMVNSFSNNAGLFGEVKGNLSNLVVQAGRISGLQNVGGIAGFASGEILNCISFNQVIGFGNNVGGLAGFASGAVKTSLNAGTITSFGENTGGLVGQTTNVIINSFNVDNVNTSSANAGGVAGLVANGAVINCYNIASVSAGQNAGGIVGQNNGLVSNVYNLGAVKANLAPAGGVIGQNSSDVQSTYYVLGSATVAGAQQIGIGNANHDITDQTTFFSSTFKMSSVKVGNENVSNLLGALNAWATQNPSFNTISLRMWEMGAEYPVFAKIWQSGAADGFSGGSGTKNDPYLISSANDLSLLAKNVANGTTYLNKYFVMTNNIYLNDELFVFDEDTGLVEVSDGTNTAFLGTGIKGKSGNNVTFDQIASSAGTWYETANGVAGKYVGRLNAWTPIGKISSTGKQFAFAGYFDGAGNVVSGVYINELSNNQGLFGLVSGVVKNVGVVNSFVLGDMYVGGVVGNASGTLANLNCDATVIAASEAAGGVVGYGSTSSSLINAFNTGKVCASQSAGSVAGKFLGIVKNVYGWGAAYTKSNLATVIGEYTANKATGNIVAWHEALAKDAVTNIVDNDNIESVNSSLNNFANANGYYVWVLNQQTGKPRFMSKVVWDGGMAQGYEGGSGTATDPYLIANANQLAYFANTTKRGSYAKIINDIFINDENFMFLSDSGLIEVTDGINVAYLGTGVKGDQTGSNTTFDKTASEKGVWYEDAFGTKGYYAGSLNDWSGIIDLKTVLDGAGNSIYGLYSSTSGLVQKLQGGTVKNLSLPNGLVQGNGSGYYVGGFINEALGGTIESCSNGVIVIGSYYAGGVAGDITPTMTYSTSRGNQGGYSIYRFTRVAVKDCHNSGVIIGTNVGGIANSVCRISVLQDCTNTANLYATSNAGGIFQQFSGAWYDEGYKLSITNCHNYGNIFAGGRVGGVIGYIDAGSDYNQRYSYTYWSSDSEGNLIQKSRSSYQMHYTTQITLTNCTNHGQVCGTNVGGVLGYANKNGSQKFDISNLQNFGDIKGTSNTGGIFGQVLNAPVSDLYNTGNVTGATNTGGIAGNSSATITNVINKAQFVVGTSGVGGLVGYGSGGRLNGGFNFAEVQGQEKIGGIVGENAGKVFSECYNGSTVSGENQVGGVVGNFVSGTLQTCYNIAFVYGQYYVGGIAGKSVANGKFSSSKYGYGLVQATQSTVSEQGCIGVAQGEAPYWVKCDGVDAFVEDALVTVSGRVEVINQDLFFEKIGLTLQGGQMLWLETNGTNCTIDGENIIAKDYGISPEKGTAIVLAYKAAATVMVFTNGRGLLTEENSAGWQVDNLGASAQKVLKANASVGDLPVPTDAKYTFDGWYTDPECLTSPITKATTYDFSFSRLYAKWVLTDYKITIDSQGKYEIPATDGWVIDGQTATKQVKSSLAIGALPELELAGFLFDGWFADPNFTQRITQNTIFWAESDATIYPKFTENSFSITVKLNDNAWENSGISIQIFKVGDIDTKVYEITNVQDSYFVLDQKFDVGYYRVLVSQKATALDNLVQLGALVYVYGPTNYVIDYYSLTLTKGDTGVNCVYILEENGIVLEKMDIHGNAQIYLRGQEIVISAVVNEADGASWSDWLDESGNNLSSGQDYVITNLDKPYIFTAKSQ